MQKSTENYYYTHLSGIRQNICIVFAAAFRTSRSGLIAREQVLYQVSLNRFFVGQKFLFPLSYPPPSSA